MGMLRNKHHIRGSEAAETGASPRSEQFDWELRSGVSYLRDAVQMEDELREETRKIYEQVAEAQRANPVPVESDPGQPDPAIMIAAALVKFEPGDLDGRSGAGR